LYISFYISIIDFFDILLTQVFYLYVGHTGLFYVYGTVHY